MLQARDGVQHCEQDDGQKERRGERNVLAPLAVVFALLTPPAVALVGLERAETIKFTLVGCLDAIGLNVHRIGFIGMSSRHV